MKSNVSLFRPFAVYSFFCLSLWLFTPLLNGQSCNTPSNLNATNITDQSATLGWNAVTNATGYKIRYKKSGNNPWTTVTTSTNTLQVNGLEADTKYRFKVRTLCSSGNSRYSRAKSFTTLATSNCPVPTGLFTLGIGSHQATLTWIFNPTALSYDVRYREVGASSWVNVFNVSTNLVIATGLSPLLTYEFQVRTDCIGSSSAYSASELFTTPENVCTAPAGFTVNNIGFDFVTLSWNAVGGAEHYFIRYREIGTTTWLFKDFIFSTTTTINNLFPNTTYEAQVRVECTLGSTDFSDLVQFTTLQITSCDAPTSLNANQISATHATHNWNPVVGALSYTLRRRVAGTSSWTFQSNTTETSLMTFLLTPGTTYEFQVQTHCTIGDSPFSASAFYTTLADDPCGVPQNLNVSNITPSSALFTWNAVSGAFNYTLQYRPQGSSSWTSVTTTSTLISRSGLTPATTYEWRVGALCTSGGTISFSGIETFNTQSAGTCPVPTGLVVFGIMSNQATLIWSSNPEAQNYDVRIRPTGTSQWTNHNGISTNLLVAFGLSSSTQYEFQVRSNCSSGSSAFSVSKVFSTLSSLVALDIPGDVADGITYQVYPNPANGPITIKLSGVGSTPASVKMFSLLGQLVFEKSFVPEQGFYQLQVEPKNLEEGLYLIQIMQGAQRYTEKVKWMD